MAGGGDQDILFAIGLVRDRAGLADFMAAHPGIALRVSADTRYTTFENDDFHIDIVYGEPRPSRLEQIPLLVEELTPLCSPALAATIKGVHDLYETPLIQSDGQSVQWGGWYSANGLATPGDFALAFDRSAMSIAAAVDGLGVVLESTLLAEREIASGRLVAPLIGRSTTVRYVAHYLMHPHSLEQDTPVALFKRWLLAELVRSAPRATLDPVAWKRGAGRGRWRGRRCPPRWHCPGYG